MAWIATAEARGQTRGLGGRPLSITCGRRHCPTCGCWRHIVDFPVDRAPDGSIRGFRGACFACIRQRNRKRPGPRWERVLAVKRDAYSGENRLERRTLVAPAAPFTEAVRAWVRRQEIEATMPLSQQYRGARHVGHVGVAGMAELAELAGLHEDQIRAIKNGRRQYVELSVADRLAIALDIPLPLLAEDFKPLQKMIQEAQEDRKRMEAMA